jgi:hypothetical protein
MDTIVAAGAAKAISAGATKAVEGLCSRLASFVGKKYKQFQAEKVIPDLYDCIHRLDQVRTLFHDSPVSISSFYYPSPLYDTARKSVVDLNTAVDVASLKNTLITGTLGQGKSVLMRWICLLEAKDGQRIPVFLELRKIDEKTTCLHLVTQALEVLGFKGIDIETTRFLLETGTISIYADGFDEIRREYALRTQEEIHGLTTQYRETRWVISTRPGSLAGHLDVIPRLTEYELMPLREVDLSPFLSKIMQDQTSRENLIDQLGRTNANIKGLLTTPLMVSLLASLYKRSNEIPASIHDFYLQLFHVAAWQHDGLKPSYTRERTTSLSTSELQAVFETFTFLSKDHGVSLNDSQFSECAKKSAQLNKKQFGPEGLRTELTEGICLMTRDGLRTAFVHRGIQEFFAASFIKSQTDEGTVREIYQRMRGARVPQWAQEMNFLQHIDRIRFLEYLLIPTTEEMLSLIKFSPTSKTGSNIANITAALKAITHGVYVDADNKCILIGNSDSEHYNAMSEHLFSAGAYFAALTEETVDAAFGRGKRREIIPIPTYIRDHPAFYSNYVKKTRERAFSMQKSLVKRRKEVADRRLSLSSILFS